MESLAQNPWYAVLPDFAITRIELVTLLEEHLGAMFECPHRVGNFSRSDAEIGPYYAFAALRVAKLVWLLGDEGCRVLGDYFYGKGKLFDERMLAAFARCPDFRVLERAPGPDEPRSEDEDSHS